MGKGAANLARVSRSSHRVRMEPIGRIDLEEIERARERIAHAAIRTPLIPLELPDSHRRVWLKLECLQPIGSFKIPGLCDVVEESGPPEPFFWIVQLDLLGVRWISI